MEFVFVVPRAELFRDCYPQGLVRFGATFPQAEFEDVLGRAGFFVEREHAERNPDWKQVIPYSVVVREGEVLLLERLARGGERRLHGKLSIGVGGHVNPEDMPEDSIVGPRAAGARPSPIPGCTRREIDEELDIRGPWRARPVGILNDDSNPVGAVHVGLVQVIVAQGAVEVRERDALDGRFVTPDALRARLDSGANLETWSEFLVRHLDEILPATVTAVS